MKKLLSLLAFTTLASPAFAQGNFTGGFVGGEISSNKHKLDFEFGDQSHSLNGSRKASIGVLGGWGFDFAQNFVGQVEGKFRFGGSKTEVSKEKWNLGVAYLQGYRFDNIMPYVKIGASVAHYKIDYATLSDGHVDYRDEGEDSNGVFGVTYGVGVKYAATPNIDVGVEYSRTHFRDIDSYAKPKAESLGLNAVWRFLFKIYRKFKMKKILSLFAMLFLLSACTTLSADPALLDKTAPNKTPLVDKNYRVDAEMVPELASQMSAGGIDLLVKNSLRIALQNANIFNQNSNEFYIVKAKILQASQAMFGFGNFPGKMEIQYTVLNHKGDTVFSKTVYNEGKSDKWTFVADTRHKRSRIVTAAGNVNEFVSAFNQQMKKRKGK